MEVHLIDRMGDDLRVVNAARVSFNKESTLVNGEEDFSESGNSWYDMTGQRLHDRVLSKEDQSLIKYLAKHNHWTPFSHVQITMREKIPIFVARQRFKHMVGFTYNEVSRRYVSDSPEFLVPSVWRAKPEGSIKQGSSEKEILWLNTKEHVVWDDSTTPLLQVSIKESYDALIKHAEQLYDMMIDSEVAPEQARMVLPQSMYTEYYCTGSLSAWARAYKLRVDSHSQVEIQQLASQWDKAISSIKELEYSWSALKEMS